MHSRYMRERPILHLAWYKHTASRRRGLWLPMDARSPIRQTRTTAFAKKLTTASIRIKKRHSSGVYICKSVVNHLRHGNFICKSEGIYLMQQPFESNSLFEDDEESSKRKKMTHIGSFTSSNSI